MEYVQSHIHTQKIYNITHHIQCILTHSIIFKTYIDFLLTYTLPEMITDYKTTPLTNYQATLGHHCVCVCFYYSIMVNNGRRK